MLCTLRSGGGRWCATRTRLSTFSLQLSTTFAYFPCCIPPALRRVAYGWLFVAPGPLPHPMKKAKTTSATNRATLVRITQIHEKIAAVKPNGLRRVSRTTLHRDLGVSVSTITRDMEALAVQFGGPWEWDKPRQTYHYKEPFELRPLMWLTGDQMSALVLASHLIPGWRGFPFGSLLASAIDQIGPMLRGTVSISADSVESAVSVPQDPASENEGRHFALLHEAIIKRQVVRIVYQKPTPDAQPTPRLVHPLHLLCDREGCLLLAHDPAAKGRRNFDLLRMSEATVTGDTFTWPKDFDLARALEGACGRFIGETEHDVTLRFDPVHVPYVRQRPWHRSQKLVVAADGSGLVTLRVNHTQEILHRVLACSGRAEVVGPAALRDQVAAAATALLAKHRGAVA